MLNLKSKNNRFNLLILISLILIALTIRIMMNFSSELISGVNGAYYPLQVRLVLETGYLGFADMPFLFYFDALIIKILQFLGFSLTDSLIINTVKLIDSISFVLIIIPVYKLLNYLYSKPKPVFTFSIISFSLLSFTPMILISDLQKNSLAMIFAMFFIYYYFKYIENHKLKYIIFTSIFLILTGLTHFGTFTFSILFLSINLIYHFRKKAIIPVLIFIASSLIMINYFDYKRYDRLLMFWNSIFEKPLLFSGFIPPPELISFIFSYTLSILAFYLVWKKGNEISKNYRGILISLALSLLILCFPLLDFDYFRRLSIFALIPELLILVFVADMITSKGLKTISIALFIYTGLSILAVSGKPKSPMLTVKELHDLEYIDKYLLKDKKNTLIVASHGIEWWVAWSLKTKIAQDKAFKRDLTAKYKQIVFLIQKQKRNELNIGPPIHKTKIPPNSSLIYDSEYFIAYELSQSH